MMSSSGLFRVEGWEERLYAAIESYRDRPFGYALGNNCFFFVMDCVEAVVGSDPYIGERKLIRSVEDYHARLEARGFINLEDAIRDVFEETPVSMAWRGDIGIVQWEELFIPVVFDSSGHGAIGYGQKWLTPINRHNVIKAYKVGH